MDRRQASRAAQPGIRVRAIANRLLAVPVVLDRRSILHYWIRSAHSSSHCRIIACRVRKATRSNRDATYHVNYRRLALLLSTGAGPAVIGNRDLRGAANTLLDAGPRHRYDVAIVAVALLFSRRRFFAAGGANHQ